MDQWSQSSRWRLPSAEGLNRTEGARRRYLSLFRSSQLELDISFNLIFSGPQTGAVPTSSLFSGRQTRTELHHWLAWGFSLQMADPRAFGLHNYVGQFLIITTPHSFSLTCLLRDIDRRIDIPDFIYMYIYMTELVWT